MESLFRLLERNDPGHHTIQIELALPVPLGQQWKIPRRQAITIPGDAEVAPEIKELAERELLDTRVGSGHTDDDARAGEVPAEDCLQRRLGAPNCLEGVIDPIAAGDLLDSRDR